MIIQGPSGVTFEARKFTGAEIQAVADKLEEGKSMSDKAMTSLLGMCWTGTVDSGPYSLGDAKPNFYNKILKSDVVGLLLSLRVGSFRKGNEYDFVVRCPDCASKVQWYVDLSKFILPRQKPLSSQGEAFVRHGEGIVITLPEDERPVVEGEEVESVTMQLMTLQREEPMKAFLRQEIRRKERKTKDILLADRIGSQLLGWNGHELKSAAHKCQFARKLPQDDLYFLRDEIDKHDAEVDTMVTIVCPECKWEFESALPFGPSFLDPTILSRRARLFDKPEQETD